MNIHIVDLGTIYIPQITKLLLRNFSNVRRITVQPVREPQIKLIEEADLIVLSGGIWLLNNNPGLHHRLGDKIASANKPTIGICLGAESLASYFGATVKKLDERVTGIFEIDIKSDKLASCIGDSKPFIFAHHIWTIESVNDHFEILASSKTGIEVFKINDRPFYGFQFHPETRKGLNDGAAIFKCISAEISSTFSF